MFRFKAMLKVSVVENNDTQFLQFNIFSSISGAVNLLRAYHNHCNCKSVFVWPSLELKKSVIYLKDFLNRRGGSVVISSIGAVFFDSGNVFQAALFLTTSKMIHLYINSIICAHHCIDVSQIQISSIFAFSFILMEQTLFGFSQVLYPHIPMTM